MLLALILALVVVVIVCSVVAGVVWRARRQPPKAREYVVTERTYY